MTTHAFIAGIAAVAALSLQAADFTLVDGASDWTLPASYVQNAVPGAGDYVTIPNGAQVTLAVPSASFSLANTLGRIVPGGRTSQLTLDVAANADERLLVPYMTNTATNVEIFGGRLVKVGAGTVELAGSVIHPTTSREKDCAYYDDIFVREGTLKLKQDCPVSGSTGKFVEFLEVDVAAGATLFTAGYATPQSNGNSSYGITRVRRLTGGGDITNAFVQAPFRSDLGGEFSGRLLGAGVRLMTSMSSGTNELRLTGTSSALAGAQGVQTGRGMIGVARFGKDKNDKCTSLGYVHEISARCDYTDGAGYLWLGDVVETNDWNFISWGNYNVFDGGEHGGMFFNGTVRGYEQGGGGSGVTTGWHHLVLKGSNAVPCGITGKMPLWHAKGNTLPSYAGTVTNYSYTVFKRGTGTWRFGGANDLAGVVAVEEGRLQFDSVAETNGMASALGTGSLPIDPAFVGVWQEGKFVDYSFLLGGGATEPTLEFTGFDAARPRTAKTRTIALKGPATILNDTDLDLHLGAVKPAPSVTGELRLTLAGSGAATNELSGGITDTAEKPISVVKEGAGTWNLGGELSFRGDLEVKAGTVNVSCATNYTWYRWTIRETQCKCYASEQDARDDVPNTTQSSLTIQEFGLFDEDGTRLNVDPEAHFLSAADAWNAAPGTVAYLPRSYGEIVEMTKKGSQLNPDIAYPRHLGYIQDGSSLARMAEDYNEAAGWQIRVKKDGYDVRIVKSDPRTWVALQFRPPANSKPVAGYDFISRYTPRYWGSQDAGSAPISWTLEASVDGANWDLLDDVDIDMWAYNKDSNHWLYDNDSSAAVGNHHQNMKRIASAPQTVPAQQLAEARVSVAAGATLAADPSAPEITLSRIKASAAGAGTMSGFAFASSGTIDVVDAQRESCQDLGLFTNAKNLSALESWPITVNGKSTTFYKARVVGSRLMLFRRGTMVLFK